MEQYRAVYVTFEGTPLEVWIRSLWDGRIGEDDPLACLVGQLGEVTAWGPDLHATLLDALTFEDPAEFDRIVRNVCLACPPPRIAPIEVAVWRTALVIRCHSPQAQALRRSLMRATHHLIARARITDEEWQRAEWWIRARAEPRFAHLWSARQAYVAAGAPPLPSSRHFRLGFLVRLCDRLRESAPHERAEAQAALDYFLARGEPPWYQKADSLHITIASGLAGTYDHAAWNARLMPAIREMFPSCSPKSLGVLGEHPACPVTVDYHDALTDSYVTETRPGFRVLHRAELAP